MFKMTHKHQSRIHFRFCVHSSENYLQNVTFILYYNTSENYVFHADNTGWPHMLKHNDVNNHEPQLRLFSINYYNKS
jgi:hypothetical protein